ncbi:MAG: M3 family metallopeptidase [Acidobacteria bacterium]|nr:M3 family metallopeptidase [Acidobacteriota bacterium]
MFVLCGPAAPQSTNPLLETTLPVPFDRIKAEHVVPAARQLMETAKKQLDAYVSSAEPLTFENAVLALDEVGEPLYRSMMIATHLGMVTSTPEMRAALAQVMPLVTAFRSGVELDPRVWAKIKQYAATKEAKSLAGNRRRLLELTLRRFRRNGADLNDASKKRLREMSVELATLSRTVGDNVLESTNAFELVITDEVKLAGLPATARIAARQAAREKGVEGWRFTLQAPSIQAVRYMDDAALREKVYRAQATVASGGAQDNRQVNLDTIIRRIIELRRERAKLLGYSTWADFQTEERMAGSAAKVQEFLAALETRTRPAFQRENEELLSFRRGLEGQQAPPLAPWDRGYYAEKLRRERYALDAEALRAYFPFDSVLKGLFEIAGKLYGVKFSKVAGAPVWNPAVEYFEVRDADDRILGYFYADFYARSNKLAGAWGGTYPPVSSALPKVGVIVGNVTPPAGGRPALLTHREVNTLFHEFGHLMAGLLNRVPERGLRDFVVDFLELPSQIMQNFTWRRECLDLFARHYQTGERIPDEMFKRMLAARNFGAAGAQMGQVGLSTVDLALHTVYDPVRNPDPSAYTRPIMQRFASAPLPEGYSMVTSFLHLFTRGYSSGYYSYKWAEVLEADAFSRFEKEGVLNPKTGMEFRKKILERGNSADAAVLFRDFMGRDPDPDALLRRSGLMPAK